MQASARHIKSQSIRCIDTTNSLMLWTWNNMMEEKKLDCLNQISITTNEKNIIMGGHVAWLIWNGRILRVGDLKNDRGVLTLRDAEPGFISKLVRAYCAYCAYCAYWKCLNTHIAYYAYFMRISCVFCVNFSIKCMMRIFFHLWMSCVFHAYFMRISCVLCVQISVSAYFAYSA
jgi:hypothetical protein